ncbi:AB hydrolase superfamily protein B1A11.02 [Trametes pubescens]|uniref:AB hydrolase superfamily protein B1A11.02 n=1 Tax=Trametes pubescens TaxID=154538 RepID=A0A1M2VKS8_TRAPU|nr:AB hydrolase superfamily protein B1A11.02 [Trametes pubescens]
MSLNEHLARPDPELGPLLAQLGPPAPDTDDVLVLREQFEVAGLLHQAEWEDRAPAASTHSVHEHDVRVEVEDGGEGGVVVVRCYAPASGGPFPLLVWYHGGGLVAGSIDLDDSYLRSLCVDLQLAIVNVGYRLAPEHVFPTGFNDAYSGLKWTATHAPLLNASLSHGFIVGGTSAGATLAASVALRARDDAFFAPGCGRAITGQLLQTPQVVHPEAEVERYASELRSMQEQADEPFLTARKIRAFARALCAPPNNPRVSPLLAPSHARLPRAVVQVFGLDPLRDEGLLYARVLRDAGVEVRTNVYPGCPHTFNMVFPETLVAQKVDRELREGVRWLLETQTSAGTSSCVLN